MVTMDKSRTPKRKRRRLDLTTPRTGKMKSIPKPTSGSGRVESKIVWKESPTDKQIKVSGTGKLAIRKELHGFVGRMTRASQQSSPSSSNDGVAVDQAHVHTHRQAIDGEKAVIKHGNELNAKLTTNRATQDIQEELFTVLNLMEQKYASPDLKRAESSVPTSVSLTYSSSTGTLSPRSLQIHEKITKIDEKMTKTAPPSVKNSPKCQESKPNEPFQLDDDIFDDLPEESWALLDQIQSQHDETTQSLALTPRPMPSAITNEGKTSLSEPLSTLDTTNERLEDYKRFLVLELDRDVVNRSLLLRLLDEKERLEALLLQDWYDVRVEVGDTLNLVFTEPNARGFCSQDDDNLQVTGQMKRIHVDNTQNLVVLHPDILVSPTRVTTSFGCLRRAILQETFAVSHPTSPSAFLGTLKHALFEQALLNGLTSAEKLRTEAQHIVQTNILGLVECGIHEETAFKELQNVIDDFQRWINDAMCGSGTILNEMALKPSAKVRITRVLATEEMMWSIKWGLKGATDASIEGQLLEFQGEQPPLRPHVLPLELKTGSKKFGQEQHQGQVILYTLLLNERYREECKDGFLLYVSPLETTRIAVTAAHVRGLILARNHVASALAQVKKSSGRSSSSWTHELPPMLRNRRDCERCFQLDECLLLHRAVENGTEASSGLDEVFTSNIRHLDDVELEYFNHWTRLLDLEQQQAEKSAHALWLQMGIEREAAHESSTCVAHLKLVSDTPIALTCGSKRRLCFVRDRRKAKYETSEARTQPLTFVGVQFRVEDRVILSAESLDGKHLLLHVSRATIRKIEHGLLTIEARQGIPSIIVSGQSVVGQEYTWRVDKDAFSSGFTRAKENLVRLFTGMRPDHLVAGTARSKRPELQRQMATIEAERGDYRRRRLIVHLDRPQFIVSRVVERIKQRCREVSSDENVVRTGEVLLQAFFELNSDQQGALERVLSAVDYALILGMPGTGKTSTIALTVRVLLFLGFSVLITSYTHSAVDTLMCKLVEYDLPMLRIGSPSQLHPLIAEFTLERIAKREALSTVSSLETKMLQVPLVGCTCLGINGHVLFNKRRFDFCIVDEASQITQPIVLSALQCADTFVLVGDLYQLPPLVTNAQARKEGMEVSLFRRLVTAFPDTTEHLSYQYRMNREIMTLANRLVYRDKLKCGSYHVASNYLSFNWKRDDWQTISTWPLHVLTQKQGVVFLDTDGMNERRKERSKNGRKRLENVVEAQVIAGIVELLVLGAVSATEIAILSPFRAQVTLIQEQLKALAALGRVGTTTWVQAIEVSTIDKYQGKDKDVILVSFVRSNPEKRVGDLLMDWRRINVALTRAKQKLLLVGSDSTLSGGSALLNRLLHVIREEKWQLSLPSDAVETLNQVAMKLAIRKEPDPETNLETNFGTVAKKQEKQVSVLQRTPASCGEMETLVTNVETVPLRRYERHWTKMKPITRNIFDEM